MKNINMKTLVVAAVIGAALPAGAASAATLDGTATTRYDGVVTFTSHGRAADLVIAPPASYTPTITEMGSRLNVSGTCTAIDDHNATCPLNDAVLDLRGGADTAKAVVYGRLTADGGAGPDRVRGDGLMASLSGEGGDDLLIGSSNSTTTIDGGSGADTLYASGPGDRITGDDGKDTIISNTAFPAVDGGNGADTIITVRAVPQADGVLSGGNGPDVIVAELPDPSRSIAGGTYDGGAGNDVIDVTRDGEYGDHVTCGDGNDTVYADAADVVAADCERVVLGAPPAASPAADAVAEGTAFLAALRTITYTPGPLLPGW